jgi:hypothetical protein
MSYWTSQSPGSKKSWLINARLYPLDELLDELHLMTRQHFVFLATRAE